MVSRAYRVGITYYYHGNATEESDRYQLYLCSELMRKLYPGYERLINDTLFLAKQSQQSQPKPSLQEHTEQARGQ